MHLATYGWVMAFGGRQHYYFHHVIYAHSLPHALKHKKMLMIPNFR